MSDYKVLAQSVIGSAHIKNNKVCQDSSFAINMGSYAAIAVSDGHGGDKHFRSDRGSALAIDVFKEALPDFAKAILRCDDEKKQKKLLQDFEKHLILCWRDEINSELIISPFIYEELAPFSDKDREDIQNNPHIAFGATFLSAITCNNKLFIVQLGDGDCLVKSGIDISSPIAIDESLKFNHTSSLCDADAFGHIRDAVIPMTQTFACLLSSDGVRNSFDTEDHFKAFAKTLFVGSIESTNTDLKTELNEFLPKLSSNGSSDDVSIAMLVKNL